MNVLIGCEFSGVVRDAFARRGHNAWSLRDYYRIVGIEKNKAQAELDLLINSGYVLPIPGEDRIRRYQFRELT